MRKFRYLIKVFRYYWQGKGVRQEYICGKSLGEHQLELLLSILSIDPSKKLEILGCNIPGGVGDVKGLTQEKGGEETDVQ